MKTTLFILIATLSSVAMYAQTPVPGGPISGTWTLAGSPYQVMGETTIPNGQTLTIEPGVLVEWQGSYKMFVQGRILAQGTVTDSITFIAADPVAGWKSIRFSYTSPANDTSRFTYCVFRYGKVYGDFPDNCGGAISVSSFSKLVVDHCLFDQNEATDVSINPNPAGGAIAIENSSIMIRNSRFTNNVSVSGGAIICATECMAWIINNEFIGNTAPDPSGGSVWGQGVGGALTVYLVSHPQVSHNIFRDNTAERSGGAIICSDQCNPQIDHNLIYNNIAGWLGGGIELETTCSPVLINNTIAGNYANDGGGMDVWTDCNPTIRNTILWGNSAFTGNQVNIYDPTCVPDFYYCDIEGGVAAFGGSPFTGDTLGLMDANPEFEDPSSGFYGLMNCMYLPISPCINAGDPDPVYNDPDGSRNDMGALWPPIPCIGMQEKSFENVFVYPDPAIGIMNIEYRLTKDELVHLSLYNMVGKEIINLANERQSTGNHQVRFDASDLPAGIYIIRLQAGYESVSREIVKL
jgi:hypothetical protein